MKNENSSKLGVAVIYALIASIIGGAVWGSIIIVAEYQLGIIAIAIGGITGYSVVLAAKEHITPAHKLVAVIASLIGIVIGKYMGFAYLLNGGFDYFLYPFTRITFIQNFSDFFNFADIIFIVLAVITAWQIPGKFAPENNNETEDNIDAILESETFENTNVNETDTSELDK